MHILLNLLPRKSLTKLHETKLRPQPKVHAPTLFLPFGPLCSSEKFCVRQWVNSVHFIRWVPFSFWLLFVSFGLFKLQFIIWVSLLFEISWIYARVHPLASYVYLLVFRRMCIHTILLQNIFFFFQIRNNNFSKKLVHRVDVVFLFVSLTSSMLWARRRSQSHSLHRIRKVFRFDFGFRRKLGKFAFTTL